MASGFGNPYNDRREYEIERERIMRFEQGYYPGISTSPFSTPDIEISEPCSGRVTVLVREPDGRKFQKEFVLTKEHSPDNCGFPLNDFRSVKNKLIKLLL